MPLYQATPLLSKLRHPNLRPSQRVGAFFNYVIRYVTNYVNNQPPPTSQTSKSAELGVSFDNFSNTFLFLTRADDPKFLGAKPEGFA